MKPIVLLLSVLLFNGCVVFCHKERFRYADVEMVVHEGALSALNESHFICYDFQKQVSQDGQKKASDYWTWIDLNWDWKSLCHGAAVFQEGIWKHDLAVLPITSYLPTTDKYELERTRNATRFAQALDILRGRLGPDRVIVSTSNDIYSLRKELKACARDLALDFKEMSDGVRPQREEFKVERIVIPPYEFKLGNYAPKFMYKPGADESDKTVEIRSWAESVIGVNTFLHVAGLKTIHVKQDRTEICYRGAHPCRLFWVSQLTVDRRVFRVYDNSKREIARFKIHYPHYFFVHDASFSRSSYIPSYVFSYLIGIIKESEDKAVRVSGKLCCDTEEGSCDMPQPQLKVEWGKELMPSSCEVPKEAEDLVPASYSSSGNLRPRIGTQLCADYSYN